MYNIAWSVQVIKDEFQPHQFSTIWGNDSTTKIVWNTPNSWLQYFPGNYLCQSTSPLIQRRTSNHISPRLHISNSIFVSSFLTLSQLICLWNPHPCLLLPGSITLNAHLSSLPHCDIMCFTPYPSCHPNFRILTFILSH